MSRLIDFYKTQVDILWKWRGGPVALLKRLVITFIVAVISLILTAAIMPGVTIGRLVDAAIAVILMTLFNALIRPVILILVAPISLVLTGILVHGAPGRHLPRHRPARHRASRSTGS